MASCSSQNLLFFAILMLFAISLIYCDSTVGEIGKPCTYFGGARVSSSQSSLVNCSWYASNACCKRTEVTSVFGGMYPLYGASKDCTNMINYMMCYFCSPEQYMWYTKKAYVCSEFCALTFNACRSAEYKGRPLADEYMSGDTFCRGQAFEVVPPGGGPCFDFDPFVFGGSEPSLPSTLGVWAVVMVVTTVINIIT